MNLCKRLKGMHMVSLVNKSFQYTRRRKGTEKVWNQLCFSFSRRFRFCFITLLYGSWFVNAWLNAFLFFFLSKMKTERSDGVSCIRKENAYSIYNLIFILELEMENNGKSSLLSQFVIFSVRLEMKRFESERELSQDWYNPSH